MYMYISLLITHFVFSRYLSNVMWFVEPPFTSHNYILISGTCRSIVQHGIIVCLCSMLLYVYFIVDGLKAYSQLDCFILINYNIMELYKHTSGISLLILGTHIL